MKNKVSTTSDRSILVREVFRLKRELVAETHRADENLRLLKVCLGKDHAVPDPDALCTIEGMGCEHIPGNDECNDCGNYLGAHDELV